MRDGLRILVVVALAAGMAACDTAEDSELYDAEEAATPALETPASAAGATDAPLLTAPFEAPEDAPETNQVTGMVRILPAEGTTTTPGAAATGDPAASATAADAATTDPNATAEGQGFRVEVALDDLSAGEHAWHIHSGPCGETAPVVVAFSPTQDMEGLAEALSADDSGHVEASAAVPADQLTLDRLQSGEYSIHVHAQGGVDHGPTVACADLDDQTAAAM